MQDHWRQLGKDERSSTVAYFVTGWEDDKGNEVLVWHGVETLDGIELETHLHDEAPDDAEYVIEVLEDSCLVSELFAEQESEALDKARECLD